MLLRCFKHRFQTAQEWSDFNVKSPRHVSPVEADFANTDAYLEAVAIEMIHVWCSMIEDAT